MPKNVVFVIDKSGSMSGRKIQQVGPVAQNRALRTPRPFTLSAVVRQADPLPSPFGTVGRVALRSQGWPEPRAGPVPRADTMTSRLRQESKDASPRAHEPSGSPSEAVFPLPDQTREALIKILDDLSPRDQFNLIVFSTEATQWRPSLVPASAENVNEARSFAAGIQALGGKFFCGPAGWGLPGLLAGGHLESVCSSGTNINDAMLVAVQLLDSSNQEERLPDGSVSLIILLTDGDPTVGEGPACDSRTRCMGRRLGLHLGLLWDLGRERGSVRPLGSEVPELFIEQITVFSPSSQTPGSRGD